MALTKTDLSKIGQVVDKRLDKKLKPVKSDLKVLKKDLNGTKDGLKSFTTKDDLKNELKPIKKDVKRIKKDVSVMLDVFYRKDIKLKKRVSRVEEHLDLPPIPEHAFA